MSVSIKWPFFENQINSYEISQYHLLIDYPTLNG